MDLNKYSNQLPIYSGVQVDPKSRTWVEVSKANVLHNLAQLKQTVGPNTQLAVVAKANAYGHGLIPISQVCQESPNADWICVFTLSEAMLVRQNGFTKPILVLVHVDIDPEFAVLNSIDLVAYNLQFISQLNDLAKKFKVQAYVHIKVDTGLSRLGLLPADALELIKNVVANFPFVKIRGMFTHFAESDAQDESFTLTQLSRFKNLLDELKKLKIEIPYVHSSNSTGIMRFEAAHLSMVRSGGGVYGMYKKHIINQLCKKDNFVELKLALSWKARIMEIKDLQAGAIISYARTFTTSRPTRVAIVPVGYWDGYSRRLSNIGAVCINGKLAPVVGRICMNMTIVDITDIKDAVVGNEVILVGDQPGITPDDIAQKIGTLNYEITMKINPLLPRLIV